jgi:hypothetical protein
MMTAPLSVEKIVLEVTAIQNLENVLKAVNQDGRERSAKKVSICVICGKPLILLA